MTGSWCSSQVSRLCLWGGRAKFRTLVHKRLVHWSKDLPAPRSVKQQKSPRDLHLNAKTQLHSTTSKLQCRTPYAKQLARQEEKPHPFAERLPKIIRRPQTPQNTPPGVDLPTRKTRSSLIHQNTGTSPIHQEAYTTHWTNLSHWGQIPKTTGTTNLQPAKRRPPNTVS